MLLIIALIPAALAALIATWSKIQKIHWNRRVAAHNARMDDVAAQLVRDIIAGRAV